jgi:hypothetical protein
MLKDFQPKIKKPEYFQSMRVNAERLPANTKEAERLLASER